MGNKSSLQFLQHPRRQALIFGTDNFRLMDPLLTSQCSLKKLGWHDYNIFTRAEWEWRFARLILEETISNIQLDSCQYYHVADIHIAL